MKSKTHTLKGAKGYDFSEPSRLLPSFSLSTKDLPDIKNWSVGQKYKLEIEVEQTEMSMNEYAPGAPLSARFRILKVKNIAESDEAKKAKKGYA
jgi:hypothetical protein